MAGAEAGTPGRFSNSSMKDPAPMGARNNVRGTGVKTMDPFATPTVPVGASAGASGPAPQTGVERPLVDMDAQSRLLALNPEMDGVHENFRPRTLVRNFHVESDGVPEELDGMGGSVLTWSLKNTKAVFGSTRKYSTQAVIEGLQAKERSGNLERVMLIDVKVKNVKNNFPGSLGMVMDIGQLRTHDSMGERFTMIAPRGDSYTIAPYEAKPRDPHAFSNYADSHKEYSRSELRDMTSPAGPRNPNTLLVQETSPVITLLSASYELPKSLDDPTCYKVSTELYEKGEADVLRNIHTTLPVVNLNNLDVAFKPIDGRTFSEMAARSGTANVAKRYDVSMDVEVRYFFAN